MSVLIAVVVVYAILALGLFLFQSHLIYFPERSIAATPANIGLPFEAVFFQTRDGVRIAGWFIPHENASAVMLSCSGNAGNISHRIELIESLHSLSVSLLLFDYRGYGESGGPSRRGGHLPGCRGRLGLPGVRTRHRSTTHRRSRSVSGWIHRCVAGPGKEAARTGGGVYLHIRTRSCGGYVPDFPRQGCWLDSNTAQSNIFDRCNARS